MNPHGPVLLLACLLVAAGDTPEDLRKKELANLQGSWRTVSVEIDGEPLKINFKGHRLTIREKTFRLEAGLSSTGGVFTIDPGKRPKTIDTETVVGVGKGTKAVGIYLLDGDSLKVCYAPEPQPRPKEFSTAPKSMRSMVVYKRLRD